jgi:uncharacterized protein YndB with AHSA1/START domain
MQYVEAIRLIPAPIDAVWTRYTDHLAWNGWAGVGTVTRTRDGSDTPNGVGSVRCISSAGVKVYEEVTLYDPPHHQQYRVIKGGPGIKDHRGDVTFAAEGDGTRVSWRCQFNPKIPGTGTLLRLFITRIFSNGLANLAKTFASETRPTP